MHGLATPEPLRAVRGVPQLQIRQLDRARFVVRAVPEAGGGSRLEDELRSVLASRAGHDAATGIEWVESTPAGPYGRVRVVVSELGAGR